MDALVGRLGVLSVLPWIHVQTKEMIGAVVVELTEERKIQAC